MQVLGHVDGRLQSCTHCRQLQARTVGDPAVVAYLFSTESISSKTICSVYMLLAVVCPCADTNALFGTIELVATCFRFAADGDAGAGGSDGGVRVPLAAMAGDGEGRFAMRE